MTDREVFPAPLARAADAEQRAARAEARAARAEARAADAEARAADAELRAADAEARAAEHGLALEVLGQLAGVSSEDAVAGVVLEFTQMMFGAERARLTVLDRRQRPLRAWERGISGVMTEVAVPAAAAALVIGEPEMTSSGFRVPVRLGLRLLACLDVEDLVFPEDRDRYAETVLTIVRVAAMALENVRAMRGLVPICASCKQIRDVAGAWHPLERWITAHSEANLSHGLCPACAARLEEEAGLTPEAPAPAGAPSGSGEPPVHPDRNDEADLP